MEMIIQRKSKSLLIATQNNTVKINYIKTKIDKPWENNKCKFFRNRDKTISHIVNGIQELIWVGGESDPLRIGQMT